MSKIRHWADSVHLQPNGSSELTRTTTHTHTRTRTLSIVIFVHLPRKSSTFDFKFCYWLFISISLALVSHFNCFCCFCFYFSCSFFPFQLFLLVRKEKGKHFARISLIYNLLFVDFCFVFLLMHLFCGFAVSHLNSFIYFFFTHILIFIKISYSQL